MRVSIFHRVFSIVLRTIVLQRTRTVKVDMCLTMSGVCEESAEEFFVAIQETIAGVIVQCLGLCPPCLTRDFPYGATCGAQF